MTDFALAHHVFNATHPCLIAEVAQTHDGSLGQAHAFIEAIAQAGADAVKFQTHIAAAESTLAEPWRVKFSRQDATRYAYWQRMEFTPDQWRGLKDHAEERGLIFLSSPFSFAAVDLLENLGMVAWKIASGEVNNRPLLERIAQTRRPVLLSSGLSALAELDDAVAFLQAAAVPLAVLQCTSMYPTPPEKVGLNLLPLLQARYQCPVGLSDHSGTIYPALAAATLGATVIELHVTLSREMFGPDVPASVTTTELRQVVEGVQFISAMRRAPVDKDAQASALAPLRQLFTKSLVAVQALPAGHVLTAADVAFKKPGTGIPAQQVLAYVGRALRRAVAAEAVLTAEDFVDHAA